MKLNKYFTIVSTNPDPICHYITNDLHHSATTYHAEGAYSHKDRVIILTVVDVKQAIYLERFIKKNEPSAFIMVTKSSEIVGKGFTSYIWYGGSIENISIRFLIGKKGFFYI